MNKTIETIVNHSVFKGAAIGAGIVVVGAGTLALLYCALGLFMPDIMAALIATMITGGSLIGALIAWITDGL